MNCQNIGILLDDGNLAQLTGAEKREIEIHLQSCAECRSLFLAHNTMHAMTVPPMSPGLAARCRQAVAAQPMARTRRAAVRPYIVGGLLLAGAVGATLVGLSIVGGWEGDRRPIEGNVVAPETPRDSAESSAIPSVDGTLASTGTATAITASITFEQTADDPEVMRVSAMVYQALVDGLREIANIELLELDPTDPRASAFSVLVPGVVRETRRGVTPASEISPAPGSSVVRTNPRSELEAESVSVAPYIIMETSGRILSASGINPDARDRLPYDFEIRTLSNANGSGWNLVVYARSASGYANLHILSAQSSDPIDAAEFIRPLIATLRAEMFPVDGSTMSDIERKVLDATLPLDERLRELDQLKQMMIRSKATTLADDVALAVADMAPRITDTLQQDSFVKILQGIDNTVLIRPLIDVLRSDASESVRLEAVAALATFQKDPEARVALEVAANTDASVEIRKNARWASLDRDGRRDLVIASLLDTRLSDVGRLEPLLLDLQWSRYDVPVELSAEIDATVVNELTALLRRELQAGMRAQVVTRLRLDGELSTALAPLFLERMTEDGDSAVRGTAAIALGRLLDEPGVRFALEQTAGNDPSQDVRRAATSSLETGN